MHYRARSYDPRLGRFVQKDPERQDANHYLYAANTPVNAVDPSGRIVIFVHGIKSQHRDKIRDMASGMRGRWKSDGMVEQHVIHFLYGPAGIWDAWDQNSNRNKEAAVKLKGLVERLQAERLQLSNDEKAKGGKGDVEPIYILAYSNGTIVTTFALEQGMTIDGAVFVGGALQNDYDMAKALKGTPFLHNYWSDEDGATKWVDGIGYQGFAKKYKKITDHYVEKIDHYADDKHKTSGSSDRVDGYSEWSSKFMGSSYYASRLSTKTGNLSAVYNARGEKVQQNDIYPLRYTEKAAKELGKVSEYHSGVR